MELYIKVCFWIGVVCLFMRIGIMAATKWPREKEETLGEYVAQTIVSIAFLVWAGIVLWVR